MSENATTTEEKPIVLTGKQKLFADYYVGEANLNATRAAIKAGYSPKTAYSIGHENLKKPEISTYIEKILDERAMTSKEVLIGLTNEAKGSIADILEEDGTFDYEAMCQRGADKLLKKLKIKKTVRREHGSEDEIEEITHEFEMYDAQSAKVHIGKAHGLFSDNLNIGNKPGETFKTENKLVDDLLKNYGDDASTDRD
jgi:phage terminase small subunit